MLPEARISRHVVVGIVKQLQKAYQVGILSLLRLIWLRFYTCHIDLLVICKSPKFVSFDITIFLSLSNDALGRSIE